MRRILRALRNISPRQMGFSQRALLVAISGSSISIEYHTGASPFSTPEQTDELFYRKDLALEHHHAVDYECRA